MQAYTYLTAPFSIHFKYASSPQKVSHSEMFHKSLSLLPPSPAPPPISSLLCVLGLNLLLHKIPTHTLAQQIPCHSAYKLHNLTLSIMHIFIQLFSMELKQYTLAGGDGGCWWAVPCSIRGRMSLQF